MRAGGGGKGACQAWPGSVNLIRMTRLPLTRSPAFSPAGPSSSWPLQDAKARFSELVRRVRSEGPQHVTVHGREEVVVVSAKEFRRLKGSESGAALIAVMRASPHRNVELAPKGARMPVRGVEL